MHQSQTTKTRRSNEQFFEQLASIIAKIPEKDILLVQGDWNAKVGPVKVKISGTSLYPTLLCPASTVTRRSVVE